MMTVKIISIIMNIDNIVGSKSRPKAAKHKDNDHKENEGPGR